MTEEEEAERATQVAAILGELGSVWLERPELRLGQLIVNAIDLQGSRADVFYVGDDVIAAGLLAMRTERYVLTNEQREHARLVAMQRLGIPRNALQDRASPPPATFQSACWLPGGEYPTAMAFGQGWARALCGGGVGGLHGDALLYPKDSYVDWHHHRWPHFLLCTAGSGSIGYEEIEDGEIVKKRYVLRRGTAYYVPPGVGHDIRADQGEDLELIVVGSHYQPPDSKLRMVPR